MKRNSVYLHVDCQGGLVEKLVAALGANNQGFGLFLGPCLVLLILTPCQVAGADAGGPGAAQGVL